MVATVASFILNAPASLHDGTMLVAAQPLRYPANSSRTFKRRITPFIVSRPTS